MAADRVGNRRQYLREILVSCIEDKDGRLAVSPREVTEQLVQRTGQARGTGPQFSFADKGGAAVGFDADVDLSPSTKDLAHCSALEMAVQLGQDDVPQPLLVMVLIGAQVGRRSAR